MCIVLLTTSHPEYALIMINNRDEFILRPTSRPHWWTLIQDDPATQANEVRVLSSRDLQRAERGTWLGITKTGNFAVLTNYRETDMQNIRRPIEGQRSRGGLVTDWLGADPRESVEAFVHRMLHGGVDRIRGFSLICGKLRRRPEHKTLEPLALISNRADTADQVPWICGEKEEVHGLSNALYAIPGVQERPAWPKVKKGVELLQVTIKDAVRDRVPADELHEALFGILDQDDYPGHEGMEMEEAVHLLKNSIYIPALGGKKEKGGVGIIRGKGNVEPNKLNAHSETLEKDARPNTPATGLDEDPGPYGTQRQTILLLDWEGNVTYKERSLWDDEGNAISRGSRDVLFHFKIDGWDETSQVT